MLSAKASHTGWATCWRVRETPLPERLGLPRLESEQELNGVVEPQETLIQRDTEHRLRFGRPQERALRISGTCLLELENTLTRLSFGLRKQLQ